MRSFISKSEVYLVRGISFVEGIWIIDLGVN